MDNPQTIIRIVTLAISVTVSAAGIANDVLHHGEGLFAGNMSDVRTVLKHNPGAFEFQHGWITKSKRVREARQAEVFGARTSLQALAAANAAVVGVYRVPVIAGLYSDAVAPYTNAQYQTRLFGDGSGTVSMSEYYNEISRGVFTMTGDVIGWVTLPQTADYYEPKASTNNTFGRIDQFIRDSVAGVDASTDFGLYDNDGADGVPNSGDDDGFVDTTAFIYPSNPKSCGGPGIWPHRWAIEAWGGGALLTNDAAANGGFIRVSDYIIQSGLTCFGSAIMGSGTIAHEMGHALGLPDLYDTNRNDGTVSAGIGEWGLMGSGNHNRQTSPAHMGAWSKDFLGWVDVTVVTANQHDVDLSSVNTSGAVYRVNVPGTREHFLLENRQRTGSDIHLHEPGLLIWHIDQDVIDAKSFFNTVNANSAHKGVDIEEADGRADLDLGGDRNRGDRGDAFPGSTDNMEFDLNSNPNSLNYAGEESGIAVRNIVHSGGVVTMDIIVNEFNFVRGDSDNDGDVDAADVDALYRYTLGERGVFADNILQGDVNNDGVIDMVDGLIVHSFLNGVDTTGYRVGQNNLP